MLKKSFLTATIHIFELLFLFVNRSSDICTSYIKMKKVRL